MKNDKPLKAAFIGFISTITYEVFTRILLYFGIGKYSLYQLDSFVVTIDKPRAIIGAVVSFAVSCFIANLVYYSTKKLGSDYLVIKSVIISIMFWIVLEAVFTSSIEGRYIPIRPVSDYYIHLFGAIVFGITLGVLFNKFFFKKSVS